MHDVVKQAVLFHEELEAFHAKAYAFLKRVSDATKQRDEKKGLDQKDRADLIYFMKQIFDMFDDSRKEAGANRELLDNVLCAVHVMSGAVKEETSVRGNVGLATPNLQIQATCPSHTKEPTRYGMLMRHFGVREDMIERGILTAHWPRMVEYCTELSAAGKPLPEGIDPENTKPKYGTSVRKEKDCDLVKLRASLKA